MPRTALDFWLEEDDESTDDDELDTAAIHLVPPAEPFRVSLRRALLGGYDDE